MYEIEIANEQASLTIDEDRIRRVAETVLEAEQIDRAVISIAIVDDATLRQLNVRHLNHDYDTDVLSFLLESESADVDSSDDPAAPRGRGLRIEGEVIASADMACRMAVEYQWRPIDELTLYVVHGLLHLAGYDDLTDSERDIMRRREREILSQLGLSATER
ncbi:MAG: rRNA maturation RNase YbeY [Planctomycetaceae bacterium]